ncbi:hypothetical protein GCM10007875_15900 [Limnobacter litoralis]|uniref:Uncharacterized protein n=1 Tax=Limnobacter litoralis TaxID=481366 RepID=A0ABQ5YRU5_9BURK|nr:hypothetical protein GCM10007875_15900 [Limnobacter litoralis]
MVSPQKETAVCPILGSRFAVKVRDAIEPKPGGPDLKGEDGENQREMKPPGKIAKDDSRADAD